MNLIFQTTFKFQTKIEPKFALIFPFCKKNRYLIFNQTFNTVVNDRKNTFLFSRHHQSQPDV